MLSRLREASLLASPKLSTFDHHSLQNPSNVGRPNRDRLDQQRIIQAEFADDQNPSRALRIRGSTPFTMAGLFGSAAASQNNTIGDLKQDVELGSPPEDSISDLAFNPNPADPKDFLAVASWDKKVRVYEILSNGQGQGKVQLEHDAPVLSVDFFKVRLFDQAPRWRMVGADVHPTGWLQGSLCRRRQDGQGAGSQHGPGRTGSAA